jgi:hypothetical protein
MVPSTIPWYAADAGLSAVSLAVAAGASASGSAPRSKALAVAFVTLWGVWLAYVSESWPCWCSLAVWLVVYNNAASEEAAEEAFEEAQAAQHEQ